ncbi:MAG: hypothetical protein HUU38_07235 [Anaerolineales bacterium]|nr:hypothetical protein [Anaerolineales bacterium]
MASQTRAPQPISARRGINPPATQPRRINPASLARFNGRCGVAWRLYRRGGHGKTYVSANTRVPAHFGSPGNKVPRIPRRINPASLARFNGRCGVARPKRSGFIAGRAR